MNTCITFLRQEKLKKKQLTRLISIVVVSKCLFIQTVSKLNQLFSLYFNRHIGFIEKNGSCEDKVIISAVASKLYVKSCSHNKY